MSEPIQDLPFADEFFSCLECGREMFWNEVTGAYECPNCKYNDRENERD